MARMTTLLTGFPGFLSAHLLPRLLQQHSARHFSLLVQPSQMARAKDLLDDLDLDTERIELLPGDITRPDLALGQQRYTSLLPRLHSIWHLAAIYDLAVEESLAYRVNVAGTLHLLELATLAPNLQRFFYVSTCYVSGLRTGPIYEDELDEAQQFKNHYEATKFWAEVEVQRRASLGLPITIFRPTIIVGDSQSGQTDKFDGPYPVFQLLERLPRGLPLPSLSAKAEVNIIPVDFAAQAMTYIASHNPQQLVYQIADPSPMRAADLAALTMDLLGHRRSAIPLPQWIARNTLKLPGAEDALDLPEEALAYFDHPARYDSRNTQRALANSPLRCPHLSSYLPSLLHYMQRQA